MRPPTKEELTGIVVDVLVDAKEEISALSAQLAASRKVNRRLLRVNRQRAAAARRVAAYCRELRKHVDATVFHGLQSVLSDAPYTQDDIERGNSLIKEHGWDA